MGGLTRFPLNQYDTISRSPCEDGLYLNGAARRNISEQHYGSVSGPLEFLENSWNASNNFCKAEPKTINLERRRSTGTALSPTSTNPNHRFVSNKTLLELRSDYKARTRGDRKFTGSGFNVLAKLNNRSEPCLQKSLSNENENVTPDICSQSGANVKQSFLVDRRAQNCNIISSIQKAKPSQPPTKTVLQLLDRSSRTSTTNAPPEVDSLGAQLKNERPPYARRFMLNRSDTNAPLRRPSYDDGLTPVFTADEELEIPRFVLPPLPLGLRPPSPEPRNLLLNAPKKVVPVSDPFIDEFADKNQAPHPRKRIIPHRPSSPSHYSDAFDMTSLGRVLNPYQSKTHLQKRPVCRVLKYGE